MEITNLKIKNNILGFDKTGFYKFHGTDDKEVSEFSDVNYFFNSYGHRNSIEPDTLKENNYVLISGCSHTMGVGLKETDVYWNHLNLNLPVYNIGISGSGNDLICRNISNFLKLFPRPKTIIIQWTDPNRFNFGKERVGAWYSEPSTIDLFLAGEKIGYWKHLSNLMREMLLNDLLEKQIKVVEYGIRFSHKSFYDVEYPMYNWDYADTARDGVHGGPKSHSNLSNWLVSRFL